MDSASLTTDRLIAEAARIAPGDGAVRASTVAEAIDGVRPRLVVEPATIEEVSAILEWASRSALSVLLRGGGTKLDWGPLPGSIDLLLSTARLNKVVAHRHGDLTATVEAGATLSSVNAVLAEHGQWLPLDPTWSDRATIGGIVATNDSGPGRHRHGAPRDLIIGCSVALSDGRIAKSGGIVVKNVAGYDLARLFTGSFGSLGVIVTATFKLAPVASHSRTVLIELETMPQMAMLITRLVRSPLTPAAVELESPPARLHVRFESVETSVEQQAAAVSRLVEGLGSIQTIEGDTETRFWERYATRWDEPGTLVKVSVLPTALVATLISFEESCARHDVTMRVAGRAALGVVEVGLCGDAQAQVRAVSELRERLSAGEGSAVVRRAAATVRQQIDPWGDIGDALPLMRRIKTRFDPDARLNSGRGPGGI